MQWIITLIAVGLAIPTYGGSLIVLFFLLPILGAKTRNEIFPKIIRRALNAKKNIIINEVYFESAEKYALDNNNVIAHSQGFNINFYELIDGEKINVMFARTLDGTLMVNAENDKDMGKRLMDKMRSDLDNFMRKKNVNN